jgi:transposase
MMPEIGKLVGIDVAKRKMDAAIEGVGVRSMATDAAGLVDLVEWLQKTQVTIAVMEASGGYERPIAASLRTAGIAVRIVDPKRVRHFAKASGKRAKNDKIDAAMIARFGVAFRDEPEADHDADREALAQLVAARQQLVAVVRQVEQLAEHQRPTEVEQAHARVVTALKAEIARLDRHVADACSRAEAFAHRRKLLESVPGIGPQAAAALIAWLPELGRCNHRVVAALVGVAPYDDDSADRRGQRHIAGGRQALRNILYMATLGAATGITRS